jgi:hypothetical protein
MRLTRATAFSTNLSKISSRTSARDGLVQTAPLSKANSAKPSSALSRKSSSCAINSAKKMFRDVSAQASLAACAASSARSTSVASERATSQRTLPPTGLLSVK